jgi:hypothetical protein
MIGFLILFRVLVSPFKTRARLEAEIVLLRHQLNVLHRGVPSKPKLAVADRLLFVWLYRLFLSVLNAVTIVQLETVIRWHRTGIRLYWRWKSRPTAGSPGSSPGSGGGSLQVSSADRPDCATSGRLIHRPMGRRRPALRQSTGPYTCPWVSIGNPPMPGDLVDKNPKVHGLQGALFALYHGP